MLTRDLVFAWFATTAGLLEVNLSYILALVGNLVAFGFCAVVLFNCHVSIEKITRQVEPPYYFFVVTFGNGFVLPMKRNGKGFLATVYIWMIDFRMLSPGSDFKLTIVI